MTFQLFEKHCPDTSKCHVFNTEHYSIFYVTVVILLTLGRMVNRNKMSVDDFQTKYTTVMDSMLKRTVAETTKLFETMVDELRAEISRVKKENEELKARCRQFESTRRDPAECMGQEKLHPGRKRDTAVQCGKFQCPPVAYFVDLTTSKV